MSNKDIIAAISTPIGKGAISCIRISGEGSIELVKKITDIKKPEHARLTPCRFNARVKDRITAVIFCGNKSYTGEESAELYFHGGKYLTEQALLGIIESGARLAEAGEFTRRAFLNGKIDLTQAEGIGGLIDGDSIMSLDSAYYQSEGKIKNEIEDIYNKTVTIAAKAEVSIDYPEEDLEAETNIDIKKEIEELLKIIKKEEQGYGGGRIKREGIRVSLTGKTNAGKSTLFNTLLKEDRAIVSDEEGTTRDTIEEKFLYKDSAIILTDTAGIRETFNKVEKMGIERSKKAVEQSDVVINVIGDNVKEGDCGKIGDKTEITVINCFNKAPVQKNDGKIYLNALTGEGTEELKEALYKEVKQKTAVSTINNPRQYQALIEAEECLNRAITAIDTLTADCVCSDLYNAIEALGKITGKNASESIIDEIFSKFCVGK